MSQILFFATIRLLCRHEQRDLDLTVRLRSPQQEEILATLAQIKRLHAHSNKLQ